MIVKDCIKAAARYLDMTELTQSLNSGITDETVNQFLDITRDVVAEICTDLYPLKVEEEAVADSDGSISLYSFSRPVIDVFSIRCGKNGTVKGTSVPFSLKYDRIDAGISGKCIVEYSYMPTISGITSELPFTDKVSARVIGYGIAAEYALINSPEDAATFDKRYKDALKKAIRPKGEKRIKRRTWA